jgi:hypothetical protein
VPVRVPARAVYELFSAEKREREMVEAGQQTMGHRLMSMLGRRGTSDEFVCIPTAEKKIRPKHAQERDSTR